MPEKVLEHAAKIIENGGPNGSNNQHKFNKNDVPKNTRQMTK